MEYGWSQHFVVDTGVLYLWSHSFDESSQICQFELVACVVLVLVKYVLVDLTEYFLGFKVFNLWRVINQIKSAIVVFNKILYFLAKIKLRLILYYRIYTLLFYICFCFKFIYFYFILPEFILCLRRYLRRVVIISYLDYFPGNINLYTDSLFLLGLQLSPLIEEIVRVRGATRRTVLIQVLKLLLFYLVLLFYLLPLATWHQ